MPTNDKKASIIYARRSEARARRAYAHMKQEALRLGYMKNKVDGAGFDAFMDELEGKQAAIDAGEARTGKG